ncbi:hypothetical protein K6U06_19605 [Acidiferrimicrobium sp. IK]|uniref:asparagine synthetase B family protein n=1 Tax=Acidiferrimicrobium sp. IK TaxID=2871700 RepID=UPI0021CB452B|nr:asparagine synthase-related protein [Acidiferrimicrobium sp. IK]MCU4186580.1 hypothetical protein [Acidiferrimicrobium sp. IK]
MCGLAAALPSNDGFVQYALAQQQARGPDQRSALSLGFCSLGVNRLAISGLVGGDQPLVSADGSVVVVFNGAIYNAAALAQKFGIEVKSSNDGEILPFLYQRFGLDFANHLEGMFAICIADLAAQELVLAVDQVGIKPLYSCAVGSGRYAASTISAFPPELRSKVARMPPGTVWSSSGRMQRIVHLSYRDAPLGELLASSVAEQIPVEVPWGCMLSGGVDSSLIAALASQSAPGVATFTCGTEDGTDLLAAREVASLLGTTHHEVIVNDHELASLVDVAVECTASPEVWIVMTAVSTYLTARRAREEGIKVLLSGEGADELFAGYADLEEVPAAFLNGTLMQHQANLGVADCLRLDRSTMAASIEARVPFLSTSVMRHARALPPDDKIRTRGSAVTRKYALRQVARTLLPEHIAGRVKSEFALGSGVSDALRRLAGAMFSVQEVATLRAAFPSWPIEDALSAWFFSRWLAIFGVSIGTEWGSLLRRGLVRQPVSPYGPYVADAAAYG